uniref:Major piroplasm surface protein n=11 Tax=Theileria TaxID=5873 RepID=Q9NDW8_THESE|nr:major piroplasm surface protein [Theileria sergenti]AEW90254.1 major piroplasm surface protein [Theileria sergenti]AEW90258.1 major piroplasm surface protein [Theileria sergenti]UVH29492.1 major piroplasm surface protein [Theileria orientalis]BAA90711.1 major piroplasm surface protein [Theileria sergenti]
MLSKRTFNVLCLGYFLIVSATAAEEKKDAKAEEKKDLTLEVNATAAEHFKVDASNANDVVFTAEEGYRIKTLKVGDKNLYTVDTSKFTPTVAHRLKHADDLFFKLNLSHAKPLLFKKKTDKDWVQFSFAQYLDEVVWKEKKEVKDLDASKFADAGLFAAEAFGTGKVYNFIGNFKVKKVMFEEKDVGDSNKAKYTAVKVYVGSDEKKVVRLDYFYTGDERFKEVYFKLVDGKWKKVEQSEANKDLHAMNSAWPSDYKPLVDKFSPLAVLSAVLIASLAVFYYL